MAKKPVRKKPAALAKAKAAPKSASPRQPKKSTKSTASASSEEDFRTVRGEVVEEKASREPEVTDDDDSSSRALTTADPVARYLSEIRRYPLLTREKEHELAVRYRETGDSKAAEALVTANLRFVVKVAAEYSKFGARLIDLVQEGNVGLMHAVKEFNPYKGTRLITYAVWWIRGYIQEYLMRQYSMVRIGTTATQKKLFYQLQREKDKLERMGAEAGIKQLSGRLGVSEEEVQNMQQRMSGRDVSLDQPISDDGTGRLIDLQSEAAPGGEIDDQLGAREQLHILNEKIHEIRPTLNEREIFLLDSRLLSDEPLTLQEIGEKYGITREAVRQMEARLLLKLRKQMSSELDSDSDASD